MPIQKPNLKKAFAAKKPASSKKTLKTGTGSVLEKFQADTTRLAEDTLRSLFGVMGRFDQFKDIEGNNFSLGLRHLGLGNISDAIFRFRFVTWLNPKRAEAFYFLGCSYLANNEKPKAAAAFDAAVKLKPDYEEAGYMLAVVAGKTLPENRQPKTMPLVLARELFDNQAPEFTMNELEVRGYQGHRLLTNALRAQMLPGRIDHVVLELGVGTGLCGPFLRDNAHNITGIDISKAMLAEAMRVTDEKGTKIYDALIHSDLQAFINDARDSAYDIVLAAIVFSYVGDMKLATAQIARIVKPGGLFAFSVDKTDGQGYRLQPESARFAFSQPYLEQLAVGAGLTKVRIEEAELYGGTPGWLCIFRK